jgi:hypothetical protein
LPSLSESESQHQWLRIVASLARLWFKLDSLSPAADCPIQTTSQTVRAITIQNAPTAKISKAAPSPRSGDLGVAVLGCGNENFQITCSPAVVSSAGHTWVPILPDRCSLRMSTLGSKAVMTSALEVETSPSTAANHGCKLLIYQIDFIANSAFSHKHTIGGRAFRAKTLVFQLFSQCMAASTCRMSALPQKRSFDRDQPNVCFAP